jgi:lipid-binding SYLF domain-containing protein
MRKIIVLLLALVALHLASLPAVAAPEAVTDQTLMVGRAATTLERLRTDANLSGNLTNALHQARAVFIVPDLVKAGFLLGAQYGTGILLARGTDGQWSGPAFYSVAAGSIGLQIGVQDAETVYVIMSEGGLQAIMADRFKLGAEAGLAVVTMGAGGEAATTSNVGADIYAFSRAVGLFGGAALDGAAILPRHSWNAAYYGATPLPEDILLQRRFDSRQADRLRDSLSR